jgi:spore coat protein U-like protein
MGGKAMSKFSLSLLFIFFLAILFIGEAQAAVPNSCNIIGLGNVNFGSYDTLSGANVDSTGSVTVDCGPSSWTYNVRISIGPSSNSGSFIPRQMKLTTGTDLLNYNLYRDAARTDIWGDGTGGTSLWIVNIQKNRPWTGTIYGRMPGNQDVRVGQYGDNMIIQVDY